MDSDLPTAKTVDRRVKQAASIKASLFAAGYSLADIDRKFRLPEGSTRDALRNPNLAGERAIASALGTRPHLLWRDRYHASGQRKSRQDYSRPPTMRQRQKFAEALT